MGASAEIRYTSRPDATPEAEISALANVYRFVLDRRAKKEAAPRQSRPDDARKDDQDAGTYTHCT
jgi:hypothetical protein